MKKAFTVSIAGKGGSGKTTLTALLLKVLIENSDKTVLVVDADPVTNLPSVLGIDEYTTIGDMVEELRLKTEKGELLSIPQELFEKYVQDAVVEMDKYDFIAMGRTESKGCYCYVNALLRQTLQLLIKNYDIILIDCEAGLEHIQRRVDQDVDVLTIITDASKMGFEACRKIVELSKKLELNIGRIALVGNMISNEKLIEKLANDLGAEFCGIIPYDELIAEYNIEGKSLLELPSNSKAVQAVYKIAQKLGLLS